jgi:hypothetical protein
MPGVHNNIGARAYHRTKSRSKSQLRVAAPSIHTEGIRFRSASSNAEQKNTVARKGHDESAMKPAEAGARKTHKDTGQLLLTVIINTQI